MATATDELRDSMSATLKTMREMRKERERLALDEEARIERAIQALGETRRRPGRPPKRQPVTR